MLHIKLHAIEYVELRLGRDLNIIMKCILSFVVLSKRLTPINTTLLTPYVHVLGDAAAVICYVRLTQYINR